MLHKRTTFLRWILFSALHGGAIMGVLYLAWWLEIRNILADPIGWTAAVLLIPLLLTPLFGYLWSEMYVQWYNGRIPGHYCRTCGYDLTGNLSGTCPECGTGRIR